MKLGLITDIHEHVENLRTALDRLSREKVDQFVMIGDVFETGQRIEETCRLLAESQSIGRQREVRGAFRFADEVLTGSLATWSACRTVRPLYSRPAGS